MFLKLLRTGVWFTTLPVAAELIFVGKKKKGAIVFYFNLPSTMAKEMTRKSLFSSRESCWAPSLLCVSVTPFPF